MLKVNGNLKGLKSSLIEKLQSLYDFSSDKKPLSDEYFLQQLALLTNETNREIAVYINRRGKIISVNIGDTNTVSLPEFEAKKAQNRLSGVICLHTHPDSSSTLSSLDIASLKKNRYDLMIALATSNNQVTDISIGFISGFNKQGEYLHEEISYLSLKEFLGINFDQIINYIQTLIKDYDQDKNTTDKQEIAYLVAIDDANAKLPVEESLNELSQLAKTAGAKVVGSVYQKRPKADTSLYLGSGRIKELSLLCQSAQAKTAIFDDELTTAQQRNLERELGLKIVDRTALILDIFAQRANTHEGNLQVELAQLKYTLPRLTGQGLVLSRLGGGIGTRGPGETKLESDRRHIRSRISEIEKNLEKVKSVRQLHLKNRISANNSLVSLIGYTNAGKSTLLNILTKASVYAEDKLFATLDPTTRKLYLPSGKQVLLTDTVGFIRKLPHQLVAAFRATLEEVVQADLLLHVIDASHEFYQEQSDAVYKVLDELGVKDKKIITVFNKVDRIPDELFVKRLLHQENSITISAKNGIGLDKLLCLIDENLAHIFLEEEFLVPYDKSDVVAKMHSIATILHKDYLEQGVLVKLGGTLDVLQQFFNYKKD